MTLSNRKDGAPRSIGRRPRRVSDHHRSTGGKLGRRGQFRPIGRIPRTWGDGGSSVLVLAGGVTKARLQGHYQPASARATRPHPRAELGAIPAGTKAPNNGFLARFKSGLQLRVAGVDARRATRPDPRPPRWGSLAIASSTPATRLLSPIFGREAPGFSHGDERPLPKKERKEEKEPALSPDGPAPYPLRDRELVRAPAAPCDRSRAGEKLASTMLERLTTAWGTGVDAQTF